MVTLILKNTFILQFSLDKDSNRIALTKILKFRIFYFKIALANLNLSVLNEMGGMCLK